MPDDSLKSGKPPANVANCAKDWGLPDWRDEASYGDVSKWSRMQWRWEFFRRRDDLREFFDEWARPDEAYVSPPTDKRPFNFVGAREKFGYLPVPNPRMSEHQFDLLWAGVNEGLSNKIVGSEERANIGKIIELADVSLTDRQAFLLREFLTFQYTPLKDNQMILTFDLDMPLEAQLARAKESLAMEQEQRHGKLLQTRKNHTKWLTYLRVLDGRECGASWSEIGAILKYTANKPQTARDVWQQANALCFNFPY